MEYLKVRWIHDHATDPVVLLSELDEGRYEVRKVEVFADGRMQFAGGGQCSGETILGDKPIPSTSEIEADPQFIVEGLDAEEFEGAWRSATAQ